MNDTRREALQKPPSWSRLHEDMRALHAAAIAAADPGTAVTRTLQCDGASLRAGDTVLQLTPGSRFWLLALGKASLGMARAALPILGPRLMRGVVAHPHDADPGEDWPASVARIGAGHPFPDEGSLAAGQEALDLLDGLAAEDVVIVLVSGGGSALLEALQPGVTLEDLRGLTKALQHSGADIVELNVLRRALSRVKGGALARAAAPARVVALLLSDVIGDPPEAIASGPTVESPTGRREALAVLEKRGLSEKFSGVARALLAPSTAEPRAPGEVLTLVVGSNRMAAAAVCSAAEGLGFHTLLLTDRLQGEAREAGRFIGNLARAPRESGLPIPPPACIVLGGETTVTVRGQGRGGRNLETALGAAVGIAGCERTAVFCFATDGVDGSSRGAGAYVTGDTLARAAAMGLSPEAALGGNDTEPFFSTLGDLWITGRTGTNVNDLAIVLAYP